MVLASTGESAVVTCRSCGYAANVEKAEAADASAAGGATARSARQARRRCARSRRPTCARSRRWRRALSLEPRDLVKTLIYDAAGSPVAVAIRGDHEVNEIKLAHALGVNEVRLADDAMVQRATGAPPGFAGPVGPARGRAAVGRPRHARDGDLRRRRQQGRRALRLGWCGAATRRRPAWADLRVVHGGDPCPRCGNALLETRGIEVAHAFMLGTKYSETMSATFTDENGANHPFVMGCYGLGIGRTVAAAIEQNHDENGIIWPLPLAPFQVLLMSLNAAKDEAVRKAADDLYAALEAQGVEVLYDDRDERPGVKFNDADLIGIPIRLVVGGKGLAQGTVELSLRRDREKHPSPSATQSREPSSWSAPA